MPTLTKTPTPSAIPAAVLPRLVDEGHGPDAWYGADIQTAIADVDAATAVRRPAPGRHNVGEIALHHAYWLREVRGRLIGQATPPFPLEGEDWFTWGDGPGLTWDQVKATLGGEVDRLREALSAIEQGRASSPLSPEARFDQVLGIAAHGAYHAGQIQLVKALVA